MDEQQPIQEKRQRGRPRKVNPVTLSELSEPEKILATYMEGGFDSSVCRAIEISKEDFDERFKNDEGFRRIVSFGRTICQAWWEDKYKDAANGNGKLNASMLNFAMKNMFGWAEKSETTNNDILNVEGMTRDEAMQKLRDLGPNIVDLIQAKQQRG